MTTATVRRMIVITAVNGHNLVPAAHHVDLVKLSTEGDVLVVGITFSATIAVSANHLVLSRSTGLAMAPARYEAIYYRYQ